ncbi:MAG: endo-1,3-alpha-glucanase family glycosylhydrolase [Candidatus Humimicrobiaceae bacterium]
MSNKNNRFIRIVMLKIFFIIIMIFLLILIISCNKKVVHKEVDENFNTNISVASTTQNTEEIKSSEIPAETIIANETISYYQIQLEFTTNSDWSKLEILNTNDIYTAQLENIVGNSQSYTIKSEYIQVNQSIEAAKQNKLIGLTVNYAISPNAISKPINLILYKGGLNGAYVNVYYVDGVNKRLIQKIEHVGLAESDTILNPKEFILDLSVLKGITPKQFELKGKADTAKKMVWAFYYLWYEFDDWSSSILKDKPKMLYESNDSDSISTQIDQAKSAGIDGFISSWSGQNSFSDNNLKIMLDTAKEKKFSIAIHLETQSDNGPREEDEIFQWLKYIIISYGNHPAYSNINGKPLIVIYDSMSIPLDIWKNMFEKLKKEGFDATFIGMGYGNDNLDVFDGIYEYNIFNFQDLSGTYKKASQAAQYYQMIKELNAPKIFAATVMPGYDERSIPGRKGGFKNREEGAFYRKTFETAIANDPEFIFITSWNEWWEDTQIEPGELYGDEYLDITREYIKQYKGE